MKPESSPPYISSTTREGDTRPMTPQQDRPEIANIQWEMHEIAMTCIRTPHRETLYWFPEPSRALSDEEAFLYYKPLIQHIALYKEYYEVLCGEIRTLLAEETAFLYGPTVKQSEKESSDALCERIARVSVFLSSLLSWEVDHTYMKLSWHDSIALIEFIHRRLSLWYECLDNSTIDDERKSRGLQVFSTKLDAVTNILSFVRDIPVHLHP